MLMQQAWACWRSGQQLCMNKTFECVCNDNLNAMRRLNCCSRDLEDSQ